MKRIYTAFTLLCVLVFTAKAQEDTLQQKSWKSGGTGILTFSQVSLSNWAAGGENAISLLGAVNLFAYYKKGGSSWENTLDMTYGILKAGKAAFQKNDDKIDLSSKYGAKARKHLYYSALLNFKSQFSPTFREGRFASGFMAPAYLVVALGMDYQPADYFSVLVAPLTGKFTFVLDEDLADAGAYGVEAAEKDHNGLPLKGTGETSRSEMGGYLKVFFKKEVIKNVSLETKAEFFSNYLQNPQNIDVNWETRIGLKVNQLISASIFTHLIYDHDIDIPVDDDGDGLADRTAQRTQFKQVLGIGLSYQF